MYSENTVKGVKVASIHIVIRYTFVSVKKIRSDQFYGPPLISKCNNTATHQSYQFDKNAS